MKHLTELERKQRAIDIFNGFTFEYTVDLSNEIYVHPPLNYNDEELCLAISEFIGNFVVTTFEKLNGFVGFGNIKFKIIKNG